MIEIRNLICEYPDGAGRIRALDLPYARLTNAPWALIGPSGSGKSTLFHAVSGLLTPTSGEIVVDGKDVAKLREKEKCDFRAKEIGCIFQKPMLMPYLTVFENLRLSASIAGKTLTREEAECLLASVGLSEYAPRKADALSGGEAQRVAFLRAILRKPAVLLADEPTSALDVTNQAIIVKEMMNVRDKMNTAIIIVTHNMGVSCYMADYIMVMKKGRVVEYGKTEDVIYHPKEEYTRMLLAAVPKMGGKDA